MTLLSTTDPLLWKLAHRSLLLWESSY